jgi:DNA/RNA-binding domain of Phe-tRNA-synthetase-like protein
MEEIGAGRLELSESWRAAFPGAAVGLLAMSGAANPEGHPLLESSRAELEAQLRSRYAGLDRSALKALPVLKAYAAHYGRFGKTYHLRLQLESVVLKGRPISSAAALVQLMFMAELDSLLLTAGHDLAAVRGKLSAEAASGQQSYTLLGGQQQQLKAGDMCIRDQEGILSSVLYGPDQRTRLTARTTGVLYTVYVPAGIQRSAVMEHLGRLEAGVRLVSPGARVESLGVAGVV